MKTFYVPIEKYDEEQRIVLGVVYVPDEVDAQGDSASAEEIRKAAERFNAGSQTLGIMHKERAGERCKLLESYIAPTDFFMSGGRRVKKGSWIMKIRVTDDDLWAKVKSGQLAGLSMAGRAKAAGVEKSAYAHLSEEELALRIRAAINQAEEMLKEHAEYVAKVGPLVNETAESRADRHHNDDLVDREFERGRHSLGATYDPDKEYSDRFFGMGRYQRKGIPPRPGFRDGSAN